MGYSPWDREVSDTTEVTKHIYIYTHHIFFIHPSVDGHLGCFHVLAVENSAAVHTGVHVCF